ncbi:MAG: intradiol ring-cleavage dioxygenase [Chitinophagales bacterium]|nr:intradiol ring-cleavage dioxygenase [Chitinophagales bacterium]
MDRKKFLRNGILGLGSLVAVPAIISACNKEENNGACSLSPSETAGPFPIKTPSELVLQNIKSDRNGIAMTIDLTILDQSNDCQPLAGVFVDLWHCDADGNYSEYGGNELQTTDYRDKDFLRGRQTTDANGQISFISIFPGWYPGRAPHIHLEILDSNENSIRVTQIAFPKSTCDTVYATSNYKGTADTLNNNDNVFSDSVDGNMADSLTGNTTDGYTLTKTIVV